MQHAAVVRLFLRKIDGLKLTAATVAHSTLRSHGREPVGFLSKGRYIEDQPGCYRCECVFPVQALAQQPSCAEILRPSTFPQSPVLVDHHSKNPGIFRHALLEGCWAPCFPLPGEPKSLCYLPYPNLVPRASRYHEASAHVLVGGSLKTQKPKNRADVSGILWLRFATSLLRAYLVSQVEDPFGVFFCFLFAWLHLSPYNAGRVQVSLECIIHGPQS